MRVKVDTHLHCPASRAWEEVKAPTLLQEVAYPLMTFEPTKSASLPARWRQGDTVTVRAHVLGLIPLGEHVLYIESIDDDKRRIQTREHNRLVHRWDHQITMRSVAEGVTFYADKIEIDAGLLTLPVTLFAHIFYRYRQWRWRRVAQRLGCPV